MPTITAGGTPQTISLPEGQVLNVSGGPGTAGVVYRLDQVLGGTNSLQSWAVGSGVLAPVGPYSGDQKFLVTCTTGSIDIVGKGAALTAPQLGVASDGATLSGPGLSVQLLPRFAVPIPFATWGDSLAETCSAATHDLTQASAAAFSGKALFGTRMAMNLLFYSGGRLVPVANCGVGGTTSTQILARDTAVVSINRRGATDAANLGAKICFISMGINNIIQNVVAGSTPAAISGLLSALYADLGTAVRRVQRLGMLPIVRQLGGYSWANTSINYANGAGRTAADVAAAIPVIATAAAYIKDTLIPSLGQVLLLDIRPSCVDPVTGAWLPGQSVDGLHEGPGGARVIANLAINQVMALAAPYTPLPPYAPLPEGSSRANAFAAPAMLIVSSGFAAGFSSFATGIGTSVRVGSVNAAPDGIVWQDMAVTPQTFDGAAKLLAPAGLQVSHLTITGATFGASPAVDFKAGELVVLEFDLVIDDGAGGTPSSVLSWGVDINLGYGASQFFTFYPVEANNTDAYLSVPTGMIAGKVVSLPMMVPDSSAAMTGCFAQIKTYSGTTTPYRVRAANPRYRRAPALR